MNPIYPLLAFIGAFGCFIMVIELLQNTDDPFVMFLGMIVYFAVIFGLMGKKIKQYKKRKRDGEL